tara:strand:+ start:226 stop:474 length:249 start_codon:yes stop_codon:yes gene_type:complete
MKAYEKYLKKLYTEILNDKKRRIVRDTNMISILYSGEILVSIGSYECYRITKKTFNLMRPYLLKEPSFPYELNIKKYEEHFK